ncbi:hypothetical protein ACFOUP_12715 [Belliella kenyensis]|uniref:Uncharacterized protein n=1 Tax=Belliella kenyensis TaxID=1472724 RepID=A0ABV8EQE0_9BACT|nr:hypothetical protein [Belliella kenyensis]MCH7400836.1 hypothetical protein [Belliella kenyensis]MDN3601876.1 hypothetical protein [Belliella kenyensis]
MAERKKDKTCGKTIGRIIGKSVGKSSKSWREVKFGQGKYAYGMSRIRVKLKDVSQSWIASIILVLNLVKLAGDALLWLVFSGWEVFGIGILFSIESILEVIQ